mmetsp:Transcript_26038/g.102297  ORF Transcript_26038/g.102297 Transcript_26038/m.102297 type:complete len:247 (-) Transcript_26038:881-1621(-)
MSLWENEDCSETETEIGPQPSSKDAPQTLQGGQEAEVRKAEDPCTYIHSCDTSVFETSRGCTKPQVPDSRDVHTPRTVEVRKIERDWGSDCQQSQAPHANIARKPRRPRHIPRGSRKTPGWSGADSQVTEVFETLKNALMERKDIARQKKRPPPSRVGTSQTKSSLRGTLKPSKHDPGIQAARSSSKPSHLQMAAETDSEISSQYSIFSASPSETARRIQETRRMRLECFIALGEESECRSIIGFS